MRLFKSILFSSFSVAILLSAGRARADLLLEPHIGYTYGTVESTANSGFVSQYDNNNVVLGGRVGYEFLIGMIGVDYEMTMNGRANAKTSGVASSDMDSTQVYVFAGAQVPLLRAWAGYAFSDTMTFKPSSGNQKYTGSALKFGGSFTGFPLIAVNVEYIMHTYDKLNDAAIANSGVSKEVSNVVMLSVSVPLSF